MGQAMENLDILLGYGRDFQGVTDSGNFKMWGPLMIYSHPQSELTQLLTFWTYLSYNGKLITIAQLKNSQNRATQKSIRSNLEFDTTNH